MTSLTDILKDLEVSKVLLTPNRPYEYASWKKFAISKLHNHLGYLNGKEKDLIVQKRCESNEANVGKQLMADSGFRLEYQAATPEGKEAKLANQKAYIREIMGLNYGTELTASEACGFENKDGAAKVILLNTLTKDYAATIGKEAQGLTTEQLWKS